MIRKQAIGFVLILSFFASFLIYAADDKYVANWAQQLLIDSLSASYLNTPSEIEAIQKNYSMAAWEPMSDFFENEQQIMELNKLILHPEPLTTPTVSEVEDCMFSRCWRVNQSFNVPELHMNIDFSLFIIKSLSGSPLLVQSVGMKVHRY